MIEKSLYEAPVGLETLEEEEPIEVEVVEDGEGLGEAEEEELAPEPEFGDNLAEFLEDEDLLALSTELLADYDNDLASRKEWIDTYINGLKLLGIKIEEMTEPWKGACGVIHPLLMESAVKFQSETIMETFPAMGPVKTVILGEETKEKQDAADRVRDDMNYELTERMVEYRPEHERMLLSMCLSGNAFKKVYFDPSLARQTSLFVPAEDVVVPYGASNLESAPRVTHRMRKTKNELRKLQVSGFYRDVELGEPPKILDELEKRKAQEQGFTADNDNRFLLLEMHVELDLPGYEDPDGIAYPYVVTIEKGSGEVLAIRRNWEETDPERKKRQHFVHYGYIPGFGFYYFGLIHLVGGHAKAGTSLMRQLVDAGSLANLPGGLKSKGLRIKGDDTPIAPGEFRDVDVPSGTIKDNILPIPYKEPSQTLLALMDKIVEDARRFASVADLKISDMSAQSPVGTTLAILERMLKVMSAVQARVHYAMKQEFKLLKNIIRDNTSDVYSYKPIRGNEQAKKTDYDMVEVIPVSDPNAATMSQKVVQYQAVLQLIEKDPAAFNKPIVYRQMLEVLGVKNAEKIVPIEDDLFPVDPVTENMNILRGKPVKVFMQQDHESHIAVHMAAVQDPKIIALIGQAPQMAQSIQAAASAHIAEHIGFAYRRAIEHQLGITMPAPEQQLPPEYEAELSRATAQAAEQLLRKHQAEQALKAAQDPVVQIEQKELEIKDKEVTRKRLKDIADTAVKLGELALQEEKVALEAEAKIAEREARGAELGVQIAQHQRDSSIKKEQVKVAKAKPAAKGNK